MEDSKFVKRFREAERPGLYCRVIMEGIVKAGDDVHVEKMDINDTISVLHVFRDYYEKNKSEETIRKHLNAPIAIRVRVQLEEELRKHTERL